MIQSQLDFEISRSGRRTPLEFQVFRLKNPSEPSSEESSSARACPGSSPHVHPLHERQRTA